MSETTPRTAYADVMNAPVAGIDVKALVAVRTMLTLLGAMWPDIVLEAGRPACYIARTAVPLTYSVRGTALSTPPILDSRE